jgi:hypothetical protein
MRSSGMDIILYENGVINCWNLHLGGDSLQDRYYRSLEVFMPKCVKKPERVPVSTLDMRLDGPSKPIILQDIVH